MMTNQYDVSLLDWPLSSSDLKPSISFSVYFITDTHQTLLLNTVQEAKEWIKDAMVLVDTKLINVSYNSCRIKPVI